MSVTRPSSTAGRSASCWALLKRWISSRKNDRRGARRTPPVLGALHHGADLRAAGLDGAELLERRAGGRGDDAGERRLAAAGRAVEHHRVRPALGDRAAQRGRLLRRAEQVLLPDHLVERDRAQARRQRALGARHGRVRPARRLVTGGEELVGHVRGVSLEVAAPEDSGRRSRRPRAGTRARSSQSERARALRAAERAQLHDDGRHALRCPPSACAARLVQRLERQRPGGDRRDVVQRLRARAPRRPAPAAPRRARRRRP